MSHRLTNTMRISQVRIALKDALHVKAAELWLKLGEPMEALLELERLPRRARRHPWAVEIFLGALGQLRRLELPEQLIQASRVKHPIACL